VDVGETVPLGLLLVLAPLVFLVAGAYASVGLGGGTGYLAVMALAGMSPAAMAPTALLLNIIVTGVALLRFGAAGRLRWRLFLPFLVPAIPAAFAGGFVTADRRVFLAILAAALIIAAGGMLRSATRACEHDDQPRRRLLYGVAIPSGAAIGLASGFLGIGGGVFLGPLVLALGWAGPKQVAAMNSCLILIVSAVGLAAHGIKGAVEISVIIPLGVAALIGGLAGATLAEKKLSAAQLQRVFAVIILIAAVKAGWDALGG
jgi:uncharacterized membrane protein YfcA